MHSPSLAVVVFVSVKLVWRPANAPGRRALPLVGSVAARLVRLFKPLINVPKMFVCFVNFRLEIPTVRTVTAKIFRPIRL